jgi:DNA-binding NarL/FixJ family response regulator
MVGRAAASSPSSERPRARAKIRLVVCDDQALFRAGLRAILAAQPRMEVVGDSVDGPSVLKEVDRLRPDVVVMDIGMPRLDGIEATRRLAHAHRELKVLILTAYLEGQLVARCLEAGAAGYVLKDVPVEELAHAIETVAGGGRYLSPAALERLIDHRGRPVEPTRTSYDLLTEREREVLKLLADGLSVKEVAARLDRSVKTAEVHKYNLMHKLGVHHRTGLVKYAIAHGLVQVPYLEDLAPLPPGQKKHST